MSLPLNLPSALALTLGAITLVKAASQLGRTAGISIGREQGIAVGRRAGYEDGLRDGHAKGVAEGRELGYEDANREHEADKQLTYQRGIILGLTEKYEDVIRRLTRRQGVAS